LKIGTAEDASIGALIHKAHFDRVVGFIESAQDDGATVISGGKKPTEKSLANGFFIEPTILVNVKPEMAIFREEVFGPVVCAIPFQTDDQVVELVNDTSYGLANGIWTNDLSRALSVSRRIKSGTVYVNAYLETVPQLPFGGMKDSGMGRENGPEGILEFMETKSIYVKLKQ
jgi:betaine-aldehyde dehydrogenase